MLLLHKPIFFYFNKQVKVICRTMTYYILLLLLAALTFTNNVYAQNAVSPGTVPVNPPVTGFGIDGDLKATATIGDWLPFSSTALTSGVLSPKGVAPSGSNRIFHIVDSFTSGDNTFEGGLKKNGDLNAYTWKFAKGVPSKCDINNLLVHISKAPYSTNPAYGLPGDTWITVSGDRESTNGNSFISIALLQKVLKSIPPGSGIPGTFISGAPSLTGGRSENDVQISAEFTGGGTNPNLYLEDWKQVNGTWQWVSRSINSNDAFGSTNAAELLDVPYVAFNNKKSPSATTYFYPVNAFIEVSFNISAIYRGSSNPCIGSIASMFVMTKSSQSVTADLSDFVDPLQINLDLNVLPPIASGATYCVGNSIANLTASGETGVTFKWYSNSNGTNGTGLLYTGASFAPGINNTVAGSYNYYVTQTQSGCESKPTAVSVTINPNATANAGTAPAAQCFVASGNTFNLSGSGTNGSLLWSVQSKSNPALVPTITGATTTTPSVSITGGNGTVTLRLTVNSAFTPSCGNPTSDVSVTINPNATADAGTAPAAQCLVATGNTFNLSGSVANGTPSWAVAPGGNPRNLTVQISGGATLTPSVNITGGTGTVAFRLTVNSVFTPSCGNPTSDVSVTINPNATADAGTAPAAQCFVAAGNTFNLSGSGTNGTPSWALAPGGNPGNLSVQISGGATLAPSVNITGGTGTVTLRLTVNSAFTPSCGNPTSDVSVTINPNATANAGSDPAAQCYIAAGNTFNLSGTGANGTPSWTVAPGGNPGNLIVQISGGTTLTPSVSISGSTGGGTVVIRLTITSNTTPACGNPADDISLTVNPQVAGPNASLLPVLCSDRTFRVQVSPLVNNTTYTCTQPGNNAYYSQIVYGTTGDVIFTGLAFGEGYSIVASQSSCSSAPNFCAAGAPLVATTKSLSQPAATTPNSVIQTIKPDGMATKVLATPNPFNDRIRFSVLSAVSGQGTLELFNSMGQKIARVFQGYMQKGMIKTLEYIKAGSQRENLFYVFTVGDQRTTGTLINLK